MTSKKIRTFLTLFACFICLQSLTMTHLDIPLIKQLYSKSYYQPWASASDNEDNINSILDHKTANFSTNGYYPQTYRPSMMGTYYTLFILDATDKLDNINQAETINYLLSCYNSSNYRFEDDLSNRYLDSNDDLGLLAYESLLITNCHAVLALDLLDALGSINIDEMIDFIWSCYNPVYGGFIGQPYSSGLAPYFKDSSLANTYWAIMTLNILLPDWTEFIAERDELIVWLDGLQVLYPPYKYDLEQWARGGFAEDYNLNTDIAEGWYVNILNCYQAIKALDIFGFADCINMTEIRNYMARLYDDVNLRFTFDCTILGANNGDIPASAIGVSLGDLVGFSSFSRANVLNYVLNGRNSKGYWYTSECYLSFHELISTYQIIRALRDANELSILSAQDKEDISSGIISDFYSYNGGFSILAKNHMDLIQLFSTVESFYLFDRMAEVDKNTLYDIVKIMGVEQNAFRGYFYGISDTYDTTETSYYGLRINPFEIDCKGTSSHSDVYNSKFDHEKSYMALELLNRIFKLNDFDGSFDINKSRNNVVLSQCLNPSYPDVYGGFFPNRNSRGDLSGIYLDNAYWALRILELYIDFTGQGTLETIGIDIAALSTYVSSKLIEAPIVSYAQPEYSDRPEDILEHTYYLIYLFEALNLYLSQEQKFIALIDQNLDYSNLKSVYYSYKITELLNIDYMFDNQRVQTLVNSIYDPLTQNFYATEQRRFIETKALWWIAEMTVRDPIDITANLPEKAVLGKDAYISVSLDNLILDDFGANIVVKFESAQLGAFTMPKRTDNDFELTFFILDAPENYPSIEGYIRVYSGVTLKTQLPISFATEQESGAQDDKYPNTTEEEQQAIARYGVESALIPLILTISVPAGVIIIVTKFKSKQEILERLK